MSRASPASRFRARTVALPRALNTGSAYAGSGLTAALSCTSGAVADGPRTLDTCLVIQAAGRRRRVVRGRGGLRQRAGRAGRGGGGTTTMSEAAVADTRRLNAKPQDLTDAYGPPSNFLEIDIFNPQTVGMGRARYTSYELRMRVRPPWGPRAGVGAGLGARRGLRSPVWARAGLGCPVAGRTARGGGGSAWCAVPGRSGDGGRGRAGVVPLLWPNAACDGACVGSPAGAEFLALGVARQALCLSAAAGG